MGESLNVIDAITKVTDANQHLGDGLFDNAVLADKLTKATKGYSTEALKMAISQSTVNKECIKAMLAQSGLEGEVLDTTVAELAQVTSTNALASSQQKASLTTKNFGNAMKGLGNTVLGAAKAHPVLAVISAVIALGVAIVSINKLIDEHREKVIDAGETARDEISEIKNELESIESSVDNAGKTFAKLVDGIDTLNNTNQKCA